MGAVGETMKLEFDPATKTFTLLVQAVYQNVFGHEHFVGIYPTYEAAEQDLSRCVSEQGAKEEDLHVCELAVPDIELETWIEMIDTATAAMLQAMNEPARSIEQARYDALQEDKGRINDLIKKLNEKDASPKRKGRLLHLLH
jgi:hypothetical protein